MPKPGLRPILGPALGPLFGLELPSISGILVEQPQHYHYVLGLLGNFSAEFAGLSLTARVAVPQTLTQQAALVFVRSLPSFFFRQNTRLVGDKG